jgi:hypothetical protein
MKKTIVLLGGIMLIALMMININFTNNSSNDNLTLSSMMKQAVADPELPCPTCTEEWYRFGTWTLHTYSGGSTYSVTVLINGVPVTVTYTSPNDSYQVWECDGWFGNC